MTVKRFSNELGSVVPIWATSSNDHSASQQKPNSLGRGCIINHKIFTQIGLTRMARSAKALSVMGLSLPITRSPEELAKPQCPPYYWGFCNWSSRRTRTAPVTSIGASSFLALVSLPSHLPSRSSKAASSSSHPSSRAFALKRCETCLAEAWQFLGGFPGFSGAVW